MIYVTPTVPNHTKVASSASIARATFIKNQFSLNHCAIVFIGI